MLLGPVFRAELSRVARRRRNFTLRVVYVLGLLLVIWQSYESALWGTRDFSGELSIREMARLAQWWFVTFVIVQLLAILALVPPLFGGAIADEKQRKTLHYLMASRLSGGEIVLDKLLGRLLHLGVYVALGLPVMSLLLLFGGIPLEWVAAAYGETAALTFLLACLTVMVSTFARRVRQAVLIASMLELYWLFGPALTSGFLQIVFPNTYALLAEGLGWFEAASPLVLRRLIWATPWGGPFWGGRIRGGPVPPPAEETFAWMIGLQLAAGLIFLLVAMTRLRPTFRRQEGGSARLDWFGPRFHRRVRFLRHPPCGNVPVLWKEKYFTRTDIFTKVFVLPATAVLTVILILGSGIDESAVRALRDLWRAGLTGYRFAHDDFNWQLRTISPWYIALWLLAVAGASASCVTVEREKDTWVSLTSTPLSGREILTGKLLGAVWNLRGFGVLIGLIWLVGLVAGGIHPLGLLCGLLAVGVLTWFVAALGTYASLTAPSTSRALTRTIALLLALNVGYQIVLYPFWQGDTAQRLVPLGVTPYLAGQALLTADPIRDVRSFLGTPGAADQWLKALVTGAAILAGYALAAAWLTRRAIGRFDEAAGRPRRPELGGPAGEAQKELVGELAGVG